MFVASIVLEVGRARILRNYGRLDLANRFAFTRFGRAWLAQRVPPSALIGFLAGFANLVLEKRGDALAALEATYLWPGLQEIHRLILDTDWRNQTKTQRWYFKRFKASCTLSRIQNCCFSGGAPEAR